MSLIDEILENADRENAYYDDEPQLETLCYKCGEWWGAFDICATCEKCPDCCECGDKEK